MEMGAWVLIQLFEQYGKVETHIKEKDQKRGWYNGNRKIKMRMEKPIPNVLKIGVYPIYVHYEGVQQLCRRCHEPDHRAYECTVPFCQRCRELGHEKQSCPKKLENMRNARDDVQSGTSEPQTIQKETNSIQGEEEYEPPDNNESDNRSDQIDKIEHVMGTISSESEVEDSCDLLNDKDFPSIQDVVTTDKVENEENCIPFPPVGNVLQDNSTETKEKPLLTRPLSPVSPDKTFASATASTPPIRTTRQATGNKITKPTKTTTMIDEQDVNSQVSNKKKKRTEVNAKK